MAVEGIPVTGGLDSNAGAAGVFFIEAVCVRGIEGRGGLDAAGRGGACLSDGSSGAAVRSVVGGAIAGMCSLENCGGRLGPVEDGMTSVVLEAGTGTASIL